MRLIIHEQPTERVLAAGELRYERDGRATGAVEKWRLTQVAADYRVLRVDLDARAAESGHTYLYHAVMDEHGRFQRLKVRFWGAGENGPLQVTGDVVLEDTSLTAYRRVNGQTYEQLLDSPAGYGFWFPAAMGLYGLPAGTGSLPAIGLNMDFADATAVFGLFTTTMRVAPRADGAVSYRWANQERVLWRDENGLVVKMQRGDGLTAVAFQSTSYR